MSNSNTNSRSGLWRTLVIAVAIIVSAIVLSFAYTEKHRSAAGTITVTGLGETEFTSDLIVIRGSISSQHEDASTSYVMMQNDCKKLLDFLASRGVSVDEVSFSMPSTNSVETSQYINGEWAGYVFSHYNSVQPFVIESNNVDVVESVSRELPSLIAEGLNINVYDPMYYFSKLDDVKLDLLSAAAADARNRASNIATNSGAKLGDLKESRAGVFQITAATGDEEFSAGGSFNLSSREKKARVTVRSVFEIEK